MDTEKIKKHLNEAILEIQTLTAKTEDIYGTIYGQLPRLEQEIELTLDETAILLEYFIPAADSGATQETNRQQEDMLKLSQVLRELENSFAHDAQELVNESEMRQSINLFLGDGAGEKAGISSLLEMMGQVKERLTEIEIVSLNAIIHAAHLGDEGRAFGVISDNINTLSNQVSGHYVELQGYAEKLREWNEHFMSGLQEMLQCHTDLTSQQRDELKQLINLTFASLNRINSLLQNLMGNVKNVVQPVQQIMVSIQAQDLIRQSMENLNKCLESILNSINNYSPGDKDDSLTNLELLNFISGALDLTLRLTENIESELTGSLAELEAQLADIGARLSELEEEGSLLASFLGGRAGQESDSDIVKTIFLQVRGFMDNFAAGLLTLREKIDGFSGNNELFHNHINGLEKRIQIIKGRIDFLQKLGILTRIELARIGNEDDFFAREISNITERVVGDVSLNEEMIVSLKDKLQQDLFKFETMLGQNRGKAGSMLDIAAAAGEKVNNIENLISRAVQSLGQSCSNLMEAVEGARMHLEQGMQLPSKLREIKSGLFALSNDVSVFQQQCLDAAGLDKWEGTSRELDELLNSLTTYLERVSASEVLTDMDMDVGSESGDLTLF